MGLLNDIETIKRAAVGNKPPSGSIEGTGNTLATASTAGTLNANATGFIDLGVTSYASPETITADYYRGAVRLTQGTGTGAVVVSAKKGLNKVPLEAAIFWNATNEDTDNWKRVAVAPATGGGYIIVAVPASGGGGGTARSLAVVTDVFFSATTGENNLYLNVVKTTIHYLEPSE